MKKILLVLSLSVMIFACSKKETKETVATELESTTTEERAESVAKNCTYSYNDSTTTFAWKAYKTSEKIGVGGSFDDIKVSSTPASSIMEGIKNIGFEINTGSVNSSNEDRDGKLVTFFFNKLIGSDKITGKVSSIQGSDSEGSINVQFTLNEVEKEVEMNYTTTDGTINFEGELNMEDFNGQEAIKTLNTACNGLHTGADGVSILWPQVSLSISTQLSMDCD